MHEDIISEEVLNEVTADVNTLPQSPSKDVMLRLIYQVELRNKEIERLNAVVNTQSQELDSHAYLGYGI